MFLFCYIICIEPHIFTISQSIYFNRSDALQFLEDVATKQVFKPWEISDELPRMQYELSSLPDTTLVLELLHKAAYRTGLGYSLFSPKYQLGKIDTETVSVLLKKITPRYDKILTLFELCFIFLS